MSEPDPEAIREAVPDWFTAAIAQPAEVGQTVVEGVEIAYRAWGQPERPGLILIHGGGAHSRWWDHLAPLLATTHRVVAIDLSGHGDSGHRGAYRFEQWADEVMAVTESAGLLGPVTVVGHSMGGFVALVTATRFGRQLAGAVIVDSRLPDPQMLEQVRKRLRGPKRVYPTRGEAEARFRLRPEQSAPWYILRHIGETSICPVEGGWTWKFDSAISVGAQMKPELFTRLDCPGALVRPEHGLLPRDMAMTMAEWLGPDVPIIEIPAAEHHVLLDQPIAFVTAINLQLAYWAK